MGNFLSEHFVAAHQQVGDFRVVNVDGKITKNGGNVASHFLTPDGRVIHSVTGPVTGDVLLQEAKWAVDVYRGVRGHSGYRSRKLVAEAHYQALMSPRNGQDRKVHTLLMQRPLPNLMDVYEQIFENVLGEKVSEVGPLLVDVMRQIERAKNANRPLLFVLHDKGGVNVPRLPLETQQVMSEYAMIVMPLRAAPALSQITGQPPFESTSNARPLIVVARNDCHQLASVAGWNNLASLNSALATGWMDALERNPPGVRKLLRACQSLRKISPPNTDWGQELQDRMKEERPTPQRERAQRYQLAAR